MANTTKKGVKYSFAGQYYTGAKDASEQLKEYSLDVVFANASEKALSLFKTSLSRQTDAIYKMMIAKYPDFKRVRTYAITNVEDLSGSEAVTSTIATMNTKQLASYIKKKELGIDVEIYEGDITRLRNAIIRAEEDPEGFKAVYEADVEAYEFNKSINDLNNIPETKENSTGETSETAGGNSTKEVDAEELLGDLGNNGN